MASRACPPLLPMHGLNDEFTEAAHASSARFTFIGRSDTKNSSSTARQNTSKSPRLPKPIIRCVFIEKRSEAKRATTEAVEPSHRPMPRPKRFGVPAGSRKWAMRPTTHFSPPLSLSLSLLLVYLSILRLHRIQWISKAFASPVIDGQTR